MTFSSSRASAKTALLTVLLLIGAFVVAAVATRVPPAGADTAPTGGLPTTVSADPLPTVQVNGVVWSQVVVGNTVYATGNFSKAGRPVSPSATPARSRAATCSPTTSPPAR